MRERPTIRAAGRVARQVPLYAAPTRGPCAVHEAVRRRWAVPPGLEAVTGPFEGWVVLAEVEGAEGAALWQALRDAELWARTPADRRESLWRELPAAAAQGPWGPELAALAGGHDSAPESRAAACLGVARAAGARGCPRTAAAFAEAAARMVPSDAGAALEAGRAVHRTGDLRRAEIWLRRAVALARRALDRSGYGLACCAWGAVLRERGDETAAWDRYALAMRMARRYGLWRVKPVACWGLCALAGAAGRADDATTYGRRAMRSLGRRDPRMPLLAHDLARAWCAAGYPAAALRVLRPAAEKLRGKPERNAVLATLAAASAAPAREGTPRAIDALSVDLAETLAQGEHDW